MSASPLARAEVGKSWGGDLGIYSPLQGRGRGGGPLSWSLSGPVETSVSGGQHREGTLAAAGRVTELPGCSGEHLRICGILQHPVSSHA